MEYAEKMYLVPHHQLGKLRSDNVRENIQQTVENDLDGAIRNILLRTDLDPYEKAKLYANTLNRFLAIVKQGDRESSVLTLSLPDRDIDHKDEQTPDANGENGAAVGNVVDEVLKNIPSRSVKNSRYILDKMSKAVGLSGWNESGEFVFRGKVIHGSHMVDLLKNVTAPQNIRHDRRPLGWSEFLQFFASLNIPFSTVPNHQVRSLIQSLKNHTTSPPTTPPAGSYNKVRKHLSRARTDAKPYNKGRKDLRDASPRDSGFKIPTAEPQKWLDF
nr:TPA_asm: acintoc2 [Pimephales minnow adintovirus]